MPVSRRLLRGVPRRRPARGLLAHLDGRVAPRPSALVRVRRHRGPDRPPILPQQIQAILDACAVYDSPTGTWVGNLRDRLLFATLAETGMRLGELLGMRICALLLAGTPEWVVSRRLGRAHVQTTLDLYSWVRADEARLRLRSHRRAISGRDFLRGRR